MPDTAYPFGLRDVKLFPFTDQNAETLDIGVDLPASRTLSFTEAEEFTELRGDDKKITSRGMGPSVEWELEAGGISLACRKVLVGGTITEDGTTPSTASTYKKKATDQRPFFRAEGQAISDNGGDVHVVLYRCRATGDVEGEFTDGEFFLTACSGEAFPSLQTGEEDTLYDIVYNESPTDIVTDGGV